MNGKNGLACITPVSEVLTGGKLVVRPLPGLPVIRDLVVDMGVFYKQYQRIKPYLQNSTPAGGRERLQSPEDRAKLDGLYECILCACCSTSCPSFLVESREICWSVGSTAGLSLFGRQPRRGDGGPVGRAR